MSYPKFKLLPIGLITCCIAVNVLLTKKLDPYFYFNATKSLPRGLYWVTKKEPEVGDLVVIDLPLAVKNRLLEQGHFKFTGLLLKPVIAINGDYVCNHGNSIIVNNQIKLIQNKRLNLYPICRSLTNQELFVGVIAKDHSLDSRYFGPILIEQLRAVVRPLITFD